MHLGRMLGVKLLTATAGGVHLFTLFSVVFLFLFNNLMFLSSGHCGRDHVVNRSCDCPVDGDRTAVIVRPSTMLSTPPDGPLAVVFTTFKETADRVYFQSNTVRNWAELRPLVQPVLFSTGSRDYLTRLATSRGWHVYPVPRVNRDGTPFLKDMINFVRHRYPSATYYGFANGDILFDNGLLRTLKGLRGKSESLADHVVIGRRVNMKLDTSSWRPLYKLADIKAKVSRESGSLFIPDAEDYFFFGGEYPWHKIPEVVMGRPGYDNFLVFTAVESNLTVIDVTRTMLAFHQTGLDGEFAGKQNTDRTFNNDLIGKFDTWKGMVVSAQYQTHYDMAGDLSVDEVVPIWRLTRQREELEARNREKQRHRYIKNAVPVITKATANIVKRAGLRGVYLRNQLQKRHRGNNTLTRQS